MDYKNKHGYPSYDDDKFYDVTEVVSSTDCTGLIPAPPKNEYEAESFSDLMSIPQPKGEIDNGFQRVRPQNAKKK